MREAFQCQGCDAYCDWDTREHLPADYPGMIKTIGGRFCNLPACVDAERVLYGVTPRWRRKP